MAPPSTVIYTRNNIKVFSSCAASITTISIEVFYCYHVARAGASTDMSKNMALMVTEFVTSTPAAK